MYSPKHVRQTTIYLGVYFFSPWLEVFPPMCPQQEFLRKPPGLQPSLCRFTLPLRVWWGPNSTNRKDRQISSTEIYKTLTSTSAAYPNTDCGLCLRSKRCSHFLLSKPQLFVGTQKACLVICLIWLNMGFCAETETWLQTKLHIQHNSISLLCKSERLQLIKQSFSYGGLLPSAIWFNVFERQITK